MAIGDPVEERQEDVKAGLKRCTVLSKPLNDVRRLLRNHNRSFYYCDKHDNRDKRKKYQTSTYCHGIPPSVILLLLWL